MSAIQIGYIVFLDPDTGRPLANGSVATYEVGDIVPKVTYSDVSEENANDNPTRLDQAGGAYFFGTGAYKFIAYDAWGRKKITLDNIGTVQTGTSLPSSTTEEVLLGNTSDHFNGQDALIIYDADNNVIGRGLISHTIIAGNASVKSILGDYEKVTDAYAEGSSAVPDNAKFFGDPQSEYNSASKRIYKLVVDGNSAINPASDTNVNQQGIGDNYIDLLRLATTEEIRVGKYIGYWANINQIISDSTITYPVVCFGSDGALYKTTGEPDAADILTTDPVADTGHLVWVAVYDPTSTALYPPGYRSLTGVDNNSSSSIKIPKQYQKLKNSAGEYVDDGSPTSIYYKKNAMWEYGAGTSGSPVGGSPTGALGDGWIDVYMIKTESGVVDYCMIDITDDVYSVALPIINALPLEIATGRVWVNARRIATIERDGGNFSNFKRIKNEYNFVDMVDDATFGSSSTTRAMRAPPNFVVRGSFTAYNDENGDVAETHVRIAGKGQSTTGYTADCIAVDYVSGGAGGASGSGFEFVRQVGTSSQVTVSATQLYAGSSTFYLKTTSYIDPLED
jgi:hypothetical protein